MAASRIRRAIGVLAAAGLLLGSVAAYGQSAAASLTLARLLRPAPIDDAALQVLARVAPNAHVLAAIVVDIDHDGDLDLLASTTDSQLAIFVNDGHDQFVRVRPRTAQGTIGMPDPEVDGRASRANVFATPTRGGYDANLETSGEPQPATPESRAPTFTRAFLPDDLRNPRFGRAPPYDLAL